MSKRLPALLLAALLALPLTACGPTPQEAAADPLYALSTHVDLDGVSQETLDTICNAVEMTSEDQGVTVDLRSVLGDGHVMYASFVVHYPDTVSSEDAMLNTLSAYPVWGDPTQTTETEPIQYTALSCETEKAMGGGISYVVSWNTQEDMTGQTISLVVSGDDLCGSQHVFPWTVVENFAVRTAELISKDGTPCGTATLSPFSLVMTLDKVPSGEEFQTLTDQLFLTDENDDNHTVVTQADYQGKRGILTTLQNPINAAFSQKGETIFVFFHSPVDPELFTSLSMEDYAAEF